MTIQIVVQFDILPDNVPAVLEAFRLLAKETSAEPGVTRFEAFTVDEHPHRVVLVEEWADQAAIDKHMTHAHTDQFRATTANAFQTPPIVNRLTLL
ncbi:putative quinol monooxygenase [Mycobacterium sp. PDNC021]|uniref:putative quinol monooxygenase n=1 Tax=Mycobacterium sp. PDNC021 TaxID=3391399 RepID=UPI003AADE51D